MKRSEINALIKENELFIQKMGFHLPPFANYTPEEWKEKGHEYDEIRDHMLGWDVTDYGKGDFRKIGLFLFTIRNGAFVDPDCPKTYAEKLLISDEDQYSPMHFHFAKTEDTVTGVLASSSFSSLLYSSITRLPPPRLMMSSVFAKWKCIGLY